MVAIARSDARREARPIEPGARPDRAARLRIAAWTIDRVGRAHVAAVKRLFLKLHLGNASLDPRFALADDWEVHFDDMIAPALTGRRLALLARDRVDGRPIGFVLAADHRDGPLWRHRAWVEVEALYVEPEWRGAGLAEALLEPVDAWAEQLGRPVVQLYVTSANERAIRFYERQGFRPVQAIMRKAISA